MSPKSIWTLGIATQVTSMVIMSRYAIPEMKKAGRGAIVNMFAMFSPDIPR